MIDDSPLCPVCQQPVTQYFGDIIRIDCVACGVFALTEATAHELERILPTPRHRAVLSHALHMRSSRADLAILTPAMATLLLGDVRLPGVKEQADTLVRVVGDKQRVDDPGKAVNILHLEAVAAIGALSSDGLRFIVQSLTNQNILQPSNEEGYSLTFHGWERYDELQRQHSEGPIAFRAMKFGDESINRAYRECFKPAAKRAGFELRTLNEGQTAGLIDNRMRVELRKSRFVVADLTYANSGAYWEAGYAEGIGRPVIYTCEKSWFSEKKTHFDTNHCLTIRWDLADLTPAQNELVDCIRATLPAEAQLSD